MTALATLAALLAAGAFAIATALLHRSAEITDRRSAVGSVRFMARNVRHPMWIIGMLAELVGFALHAVAVHDGPLTLVQPLLVTGLVFALPVRALLDGRHPRRTELAWAAALAAGLVTFLLVATPVNGPSDAPDFLPSVVAAVTIALALATALLEGLRTGGRHAGMALAFGAGTAFAAVAALLKVVTAELARGGPLAALGDWPLWALALTGATGMILEQLAFRVATLPQALPVLSIVDPLASILIGWAVFDEPFRHSPLAIAAEAAGLALVVMTATALARVAPGGAARPGPA